MVICNSCRNLFAMGDEVLQFDLNGVKATLCVSCYEKLPKKKKKQLRYTGSKESLINPGAALGFAAGGVFSGIAGGAGYRAGMKRSLKKDIAKLGLTIKKLDNYTIDKFNCHFMLCNKKEQQKALNKFQK